LDREQLARRHQSTGGALFERKLRSQFGPSLKLGVGRAEFSQGLRQTA